MTRKRYIKLLLSLGLQRNEAHAFVQDVRTYAYAIQGKEVNYKVDAERVFFPLRITPDGRIPMRSGIAPYIPKEFSRRIKRGQ